MLPAGLIARSRLQGLGCKVLVARSGARASWAQASCSRLTPVLRLGVLGLAFWASGFLAPGCFSCRLGSARRQRFGLAGGAPAGVGGTGPGGTPSGASKAAIGLVWRSTLGGHRQKTPQVPSPRRPAHPPRRRRDRTVWQIGAACQRLARIPASDPLTTEQAILASPSTADRALGLRLLPGPCSRFGVGV